MSFWSWLSGRNDIYLDEDAIEDLYGELDNIKLNPIENAKQDCRDAIKKLNEVTGMKDYVGAIGENSFDSIYEEIASAVDIIKEQVEQNVADIVAYSESTTWEKIGSTLAMTGAKFGEGALSVFESIGDGIISVGGYIGGGLGAKEFQEGCAKIIQKSWSHDIFNFYYNSDYAKASVYTENSGAASIVKIAGQTASYLALGGFSSGLGEAMLAKGGKVMQGVGKFLSSTTRVNTTIAGVGGLGQGTETGLNSGLSYNESFGKGVEQSLIQGTTAFAFGKLGEKAQRNAATKESQKVLEKAQKEAENAKAALGKAEQGIADAQKTLDGATKAKPGIESKLTKTQNRVDGLEKSKINNPKKFTRGDERNLITAKNKVSSLQKELNGIDTKITEAGKNLTAAQEGRIAAEKTVNIANKRVADASEAVKAAQNAKYQGYTDSITRAGQRAGSSLGTNGLKTTAKNVVNNVKQGISNLGQPLERNSLAQSQGTLAKVKDTGAAIYNNSGTVGRKVIEGVSQAVVAPAKATVAVGKGMVGAVAQQSSVAGKVGVVGLEAAGTTTGIKFNYDNAQARTSANNLNVVKPAIQSLGENLPTTVNITAPQSSYNGNQEPNITNGINAGGSNYGGTAQQPQATTSTTVTPPSTSPTPAASNTTISPTPNPTTPTNPTEPTTPTTPGTTITNPEPTPTTPVRNDNGRSNSGINHGGSSSNGNYTFTNSGISASQDESIEILTEEKPVDDQITSLLDDNEDIYTIPTDLSGVTSTKKHSSSGASGVIPILGGLGAAAAVGVGAKIYMDNKKNNDNDEDFSESDDDTEDWEETSNENDGILADEWNEDDSNFEFDDTDPNTDNDESGFGEI